MDSVLARDVASDSMTAGSQDFMPGVDRLKWKTTTPKEKTQKKKTNEKMKEM